MKVVHVFALLSLMLWSANDVWTQMQLPEGFAAELMVDELNPVAMTVDHHGRIWLLEKNGEVLIVEDGEVLPDPFLVLNVDDWNERGLSGIALHPDMDNLPYVYLYYTVPGANHNRLSRFTANGDVAVPGSEEILLELDPLSGTIHNGGAMVFGNDGKLYLAVGDAANAANASNLNNLHGKILRLNDDGSIPEDNPFHDQLDGKERAIFAYGFRNPFSMAYDEETGRLLVGDVGGELFEEVNEILAGRNYGWPDVEGYLGGGMAPPNYQDPLYSYSHDEGCAVVGASFYRSLIFQFPVAYHGKFFFGDYCANLIRMIDPENPEAVEVFASGIERPLALHTDPYTGDLYFLGRAGIGGGSQTDNTSTNEGTLWRIFYTGSGAPNVSVQPQDLLIPAGENARFQIAAVGTAPLSYQWLENGLPLAGATDPILDLTNVPLGANGNQLRCVVYNPSGSDTSDVAILSVTANQRPVPLITSPIEGNLFRAGDLIQFAGSATDPEEGDLTADNLIWKIDWHHDQHTHPVLPATQGLAGGEWTVPTVNETDPDVWYRIYLTARDNEGLEQTVYTEIFPDFATVTLDGTAGIPINVDGLIRTQPYSFESLIGIQRTLVAPIAYRVGDSLYTFQSWADGSTDLTLQFLTPEETYNIGAQYTAVSLGSGTGLYAEYFDDPELDLQGQPTVTRVDTTVSFVWGGGSPDPALPDDYFTVRWQGEIEPLFDELYTFYINSDDGARLWIGEELILDHWVPQAPTEHSASIPLEAEQRYPIRIEYMEIGGGAEINFFWSSPSTNKEIVPKLQLYPLAERASIAGEVWLDANQNDVFDNQESALENVTVLLYWQADTSLVDVQQTDVNGNYNFSELRAGSYYLHFLSQSTGVDLSPGTNLLADGITEIITLGNEENRLLDVSFYPGVTRTSESSAFPVLSINPNPTDGLVSLAIQPFFSTTYQFSWYDIRGRKLAESSALLSSDNLHRQDFDLSAWPKGLYVLSINGAGGEASLRVVKL